MALGSLAGGDMKPLATSDDLDTIILFSYRWPLPSAMTSTRATTGCLVLGGINDGKIPSERYRHCGSRRGATRADEARSGVPSLGYVPSRPGRCCLVRAVLGEEEAEVDPISGGNPKGGGGMGFLVEEVILSDSGGGLRFRQKYVDSSRGGGPRGGGGLGVWEAEEDPYDSDGPMGSGDLAI
uniref:Uncharacterized protein n=2 Tax=Oryza sativa subsp. japonica TaxID=39947 RepID=Q851P7_ORYSJ|nr:hypothetical protein [Oryza sativa Japonica Group]ABF99366.1 hypothetical protein LOC_Os03g58450 [Oryza sativa Japonica Group]